MQSAALGTLSAVRGTYDRHENLEEKRKALEKLADLLELILHPMAGNNLPMRAGAEADG
jgi:hypothetical protein